MTSFNIPIACLPIRTPGFLFALLPFTVGEQASRKSENGGKDEL